MVRDFRKLQAVHVNLRFLVAIVSCERVGNVLLAPAITLVVDVVGFLRIGAFIPMIRSITARGMYPIKILINVLGTWE